MKVYDEPPRREPPQNTNPVVLMKKQCAGLLAAIFLFLFVSPLLSQDEANKAIREYKAKVSGANKTYVDSVEGAREKKRQEIAAATEAALKALKDELAKTGPGGVARAIALAKRIYQLDPTDKEAQEILLAANIDLNEINPAATNNAPPAKPKENPAPAKLPTQPKNPPRPAREQTPNPGAVPGATAQPEFGSLRDKISQLARRTGVDDSVYPIQKNRRPLTLPGGTSAWVVGLGLASLDSYDPWDGWQISQDMTFLKAGGFFGASDSVTFGFETGFGFISDDEFGSDSDLLPIELSSLLSLYKSETVQMAGSAYLPLNISGPGDTFTGIRLGLPTRFNFADDAVALYLGEGLLSLGSDETSINLTLSLGFQLSDNLNIHTSFTPVQTADYTDGVPFGLVFSYSFTPASEFALIYRTINDVDTIFIGWVFRNL